MSSAQLSERQGNAFFALVLMASVMGLGIGFAVPLFAAYQPKTSYQPKPYERNTAQVLNVSSVIPAANQAEPRSLQNLEVQRLVARNRRLEALVQTLRHENAKAQPSKPAAELGPQPEW